MSNDGHEIVEIYDIRSIADKYFRPKFDFNFSDLRGLEFRNNSKPQYRLVMSVINERCLQEYNPIKQGVWLSSFLAAMGKSREAPKKNSADKGGQA